MDDTAFVVICTISAIYLVGLLIYVLTHWCLAECNRTPIEEPLIEPGSV